MLLALLAPAAVAASAATPRHACRPAWCRVRSAGCCFALAHEATHDQSSAIVNTGAACGMGTTFTPSCRARPPCRPTLLTYTHLRPFRRQRERAQRLFASPLARHVRLVERHSAWHAKPRTRARMRATE